MRLAILTDIHGNREALEAVLDNLALRRVDRVVLLGDLVGYGPDPQFCADRAQALVAAGAICVKGNHDHALAHGSAGFSLNASITLDWSRDRLDAGALAFLEAQPMTATLSHESAGDDLCFAHASPQRPAEWRYVTSPQTATGAFHASPARVICCGHVHVPMLVSADLAGSVREHRIPASREVQLLRSRRWLAVLGSVGQPRDRNPAAGYGILDTETDLLQFRRVAYDCATTAQKLRAARLPEALALRLMSGS